MRRAPTEPPGTYRSEEVILETRVIFKAVQRSGWQPCRLLLSPRAMILLQGGRPVLEVPANRIVATRIERLPAALSRKRQVLRLEYRAARSHRGLSRIWLTGTDIHTLRERLMDAAAPLDLAAIESFLRHLDADARSIVQLVWERRHATIRELAEHTRLPSHTDILLKIREVINPLAEESLGFPILVFAPARLDTVSGEDVLYSWWIVGASSGTSARRPEILVDTFDEPDSFSILACLPCAEASEVSVSFPEGQVEISAGEDLKPASVSLPPGLQPGNRQQAFRNGILELRWDRA